MQEPDNHIDHLNRNYPEPDIPVEEAWRRMNIQLDAELPLSGGYVAAFKKMIRGVWGKLSIGLVLIIAFSWMYSSTDAIIQKKDEQNVIAKKKENDPTQSLHKGSLWGSAKRNEIKPDLNNESSSSIIENDVPAKPEVRKMDDNEQKEVSFLKSDQHENNKNPFNSEMILSDQRADQERIINNKASSEKLLQKKNIALTASDINKSAVSGSTEIAQLMPIQLVNVSSSTLSIKDKSYKEVKLPVDSSKKRKSFLHFMDAGLQWNIPLSPNANGTYFTGSSGDKQVYKTFIPSVWLSKRWNKNEVLATFNLYQQNFINNKPIADFTDQSDPADSTTIINHKSAVFKTMGIGFGLIYNYQISDSWVVGAGLTYNQQKNAIIHQTDTRVINNTIITDSVFAIITKDHDYLKPYFIGAKFEAMYRVKRFDLGVNLQIPLTNQSANTAFDIKSINTQLFLRWRLWTN